MVGIVYSLVLRALWSPQGWQRIADAALHDITPVVFVFFFPLRRHGSLRWRDSAYAVVLPAAYVAYAFVRGAADGWYAYHFLDPSKLSIVQVAANIAGLTVAFLVVALVLIGLTRLTSGPTQDPDLCAEFGSVQGLGSNGSSTAVATSARLIVNLTQQGRPARPMHRRGDDFGHDDA